jgi:hypothetical protein
MVHFPGQMLHNVDISEFFISLNMSVVNKIYLFQSIIFQEISRLKFP